MHFSTIPIFQSIIFALFIFNVAAVRGGHSDGFGSREWRAVRAARRRTVSSSAVDVQGLDALKSYVCAATNANTKRDLEIDSGTTTISIPVTDLQSLYAAVEQLLAELAVLITQQGLTVASSSISISAQTLTAAGGTSTVISIPAVTVPPTSSATGDNEVLVVDGSLIEELPATAAPPAATSQIVATSTDSDGVVTVFVTQLTTVTYTPPAAAVSTAAGSSSTTAPTIVSTTEQSVAATSAAASSVVVPAQSTASSASQTNTAVSTNDASQSYSSINIGVLISSTTVNQAVGTTSTSATTTTSAPQITASTTSEASSDTESECYDDEETSTSSTPLVFQTGATYATTVAVTTSLTTTSASVAASSTTSATGGVFKQGSSTTTTTAASATASSGYQFNAAAKTNINAYFGQTPVTSGTTLVAQCADANIDIVTLSFIIANNYESSGYPQVNFGAACGGQTDEMESDAPGLLYCPDLAGMISTCQTTYGKKVLLSIGGSASSIAFSTSSEATAFGDVLWKLFGPPGSIDTGLRPFGNVTIDGFDIDNEDNEPTNYDVLGSTLKTNFATDTSKSYYLTSAPQCPFPDASDPEALILMCDFVFVQFYNNPSCEVGSSGFSASVSQWSTFLETSTLATKPKLYVGAPAWSAAGPTAYANIISSTGNAEGIEAIAANLTSVSNLGGMSFWDGPEGMLNIADGKDIIAWAKEGLTS